jgi:succinate dehydrogenase / fumarate reductase cytochrome b subunit
MDSSPRMEHTMAAPAIPNPFLWRRLHSLAGLWLVLFLFLHLLTNSQAALLVGDDGIGFIEGANSLEAIPYIRVLEIVLLALPFGIHILFGIHRLFMAKSNSWPSDGTKPALTGYPRNHAYTWMRITSWVILVGVILHVVHMRFLDYPWSVEKDGHESFMTVVGVDSGLYTLSERLDVALYDERRIKQAILDKPTVMEVPASDGIPGKVSLLTGPKDEAFNEAKLKELRSKQDLHEWEQWIAALQHKPIDDYHVVVVAKNFGTASLLIVRETFKSPIMVALYSLFVLFTCYHAFNGFWTFLITWGVTLTERSQRLARYLSTVLMLLVAFLGLAAAIGTYWINLRS